MIESIIIERPKQRRLRMRENSPSEKKEDNSHGNDTKAPFYFNTNLTNIIKKYHKTEKNN